MSLRFHSSLIAFLALSFSSVSFVHAGLIEFGDLNIIDDVTNTSNGLRYLDMTYSTGLTSADALANAQSTYANARLATASEFDDLFFAAGIGYSGSLTAADGFSTGAPVNISDSSLDINQLSAQLGLTGNGHTYIWTDPDGIHNAATTFDLLILINPVNSGSYARLGHNTGTTPASLPIIGWLLVSDAVSVPEPASFALLSLGLFGLGWRRSKRSRVMQR